MTLVPASSHPSSGGGGFTIGSSYIILEATASQTSAPPAVTVVAWDQLHQAGADLTLTGGSGNPSVAINTAGWYGFGWSLSLRGTLGDVYTPSYVFYPLPVDSTDFEVFPWDTAATPQLAGPAGSVAPFPIAAPTALTLSVQGVSASVSPLFNIDDGYLCVTRFA